MQMYSYIINFIVGMFVVFYLLHLSETGVCARACYNNCVLIFPHIGLYPFLVL